MNKKALSLIFIITVITLGAAVFYFIQPTPEQTHSTVEISEPATDTSPDSIQPTIEEEDETISAKPSPKQKPTAEAPKEEAVEIDHE